MSNSCTTTTCALDDKLNIAERYKVGKINDLKANKMSRAILQWTNSLFIDSGKYVVFVVDSSDAVVSKIEIDLTGMPLQKSFLSLRFDLTFNFPCGDNSNSVYQQDPWNWYKTAWQVDDAFNQPMCSYGGPFNIEVFDNALKNIKEYPVSMIVEFFGIVSPIMYTLEREEVENNLELENKTNFFGDTYEGPTDLDDSYKESCYRCYHPSEFGRAAEPFTKPYADDDTAKNSGGSFHIQVLLTEQMQRFKEMQQKIIKPVHIKTGAQVYILTMSSTIIHRGGQDIAEPVSARFKLHVRSDGTVDYVKSKQLE